MHEITVRTKPATIPEYFEVDLTGLEIGHSIHLSALKVPEGVRVVTRDKNPTVASIAAPTVVRESGGQGGRGGGSGGGSRGAAAPAAGAPRQRVRLRRRVRLRQQAAAPAPAKK